MTRYEPMKAPASSRPGYDIYLIDGFGRVCESGWIAADDDDDALSFVRSLGLNHACEVWQLNRRVGLVAGIAGLASAAA